MVLALASSAYLFYFSETLLFCHKKTIVDSISTYEVYIHICIQLHCESCHEDLGDLGDLGGLGLPYS